MLLWYERIKCRYFTCILIQFTLCETFHPEVGQNVSSLNITCQPTVNLDDKNKDWLCNAFELYAMKYPTSHLYLLGMQASINVGVKENTSEKRVFQGIPRETVAECFNAMP